MSDVREDSASIAGRVADGGPVDWDEAIRTASNDRERRMLGHLRLVESVARVHRTSGSEDSISQDPPTIAKGSGSGGRAGLAPATGTWGHLELRERLGEGGFGEVYRAWDRRLHREVALKLLKAGDSVERRVVALVLDEGRMLAKLRHPNAVTVYGTEVHDGRAGIWMELIRGRSLEQLLQDQGPFGAREAAVIGIDLCRALAAVHRAGVIHRDVKAQNAMREAGGRILLTDFGAGIEAGDEFRERPKILSGTPHYMASELLAGKPASQRSDIFSLGVLLYRLVTGKFPIEATSWEELRARHARRESRLLRDERPDLPEEFVKVVERAMAWTPEERFATAGRMEQALSVALGTGVEPAADRASAPGHRRALALGAAALLAAGALLASLLLVPGFLRRSGAPAPGAGSAAVPAGPGETSDGHDGAEQGREPAAPALPGSYTVEAALYRVASGSVVPERLDPGARLTLGDRLTLEFRASRPLHVYVINEDEEGRAFALFPLPGFDQRNPLRPETTHVLPGTRDGSAISWTVDTPGGREHLLLVASPSRLVDFEAEMNALARPGEIAVPIPNAARVHLRGIGGLAETPAASAGAPAGRLFEMAHRLASRAEVVSGVWMRRIDLENPPPR